MSDNQKVQLFSNVAEAMEGVPKRVRAHQLVHYYKAGPDYSLSVAEKLWLDYGLSYRLN